MQFIEHKIPKLVRVDSPSGRVYETPDGNRYPSVTGIVGSLHAEEIAAWREKVGDKVADEISNRAATRGTLIHENCERYLRKEPLTFSMFQMEEHRMFKCLVPIMDRIIEVHAMETPLYSDKLQVAGTVDLIARLEDGELYVVDWKTSSKFKNEEDIPHYFMQCAFYSFAFYERTGIIPSKIKIAMTTEEFGLLEFNQPAAKWLQNFIEVRNDYREKNGR